MKFRVDFTPEEYDSLVIALKKKIDDEASPELIDLVKLYIKVNENYRQIEEISWKKKLKKG